MSLGFRYNEINDFYELLDSFINTLKATTNETNDRENRILSYVMPLYDKYFNAYKKYDCKKVKNEGERGRDYKRFKKFDNRDQGPKSTKKEETETKKILTKYKNHYGLK